MAADDPRIGTTLKEKWHIDSLLGRGGMASVYAATHRNGKRVAVKILNPDISAVPELRARFLREGYLANKVAHVGAVSVDDDDVTSDGAAFLVMELLVGETLEARRERMPGGRLPAHEVVRFGDQVLDTLAAAHALGIVHRDVKPENLFLTHEGVVKILDFGIARLREGGSAKSSTTMGAMMGTPAYLPPEQARGRWDEVDAQSDLWSLGATMFTLLTDRHVHEAETVNEVLLLAMTAAAPKLLAIAPEAPPTLAAGVDRALARDKAARWPDAPAMRDALREVRDESGTRLAAESHHRIAIPEASGASQSIASLPTLMAGTLGVREPRRPALPRRAAIVGGVVAALATTGAALWLRSPASTPSAVAFGPEPSLTAARPEPPVASSPFIISASPTGATEASAARDAGTTSALERSPVSAQPPSGTSRKPASPPRIHPAKPADPFAVRN